MPEHNPETTFDSEVASNGDPSLGPNDVRLEIKLSLIGQRKILVGDDASMKLSNALTLAARGTVAATIESAVQLLVQNLLTQFNELLLTRGENVDPQKVTAEHRSKAGTPHSNPPPEFPDRLPQPPSKT
jgi:hypothetical protein